MPLDPETGKRVYTFTNILAFTISILCTLYLFLAAFVLSKSESKDNSTLTQITTGVLNLLMLIMAFYFGSSSNSARQQQQITDMQKTSTALAITTANANGGTAITENKIDKAVKIEQLKAALKDLEPDSDDAKKLLAELEELEKI